MVLVILVPAIFTYTKMTIPVGIVLMMKRFGRLKRSLLSMDQTGLYKYKDLYGSA